MTKEKKMLLKLSFNLPVYAAPEKTNAIKFIKDPLDPTEMSLREKRQNVKNKIKKSSLLYLFLLVSLFILKYAPDSIAVVQYKKTIEIFNKNFTSNGSL